MYDDAPACFAAVMRLDRGHLGIDGAGKAVRKQ